jgi:hypothetical protein
MYVGVQEASVPFQWICEDLSVLLPEAVDTTSMVTYDLLVELSVHGANGPPDFFSVHSQEITMLESQVTIRFRRIQELKLLVGNDLGAVVDKWTLVERAVREGLQRILCEVERRQTAIAGPSQTKKIVLLVDGVEERRG